MDRSDNELRHELAAAPSPERFQPFLDRYLRFVYGAAFRQTGNEADAAEVTRAVFLALARRVRRLPPKVVLVGWLFQATRLTARKVRHIRKHPTLSATQGTSERTITGDDDTWARLSPVLDPCLSRLPPKQCHSLLLRFLLNWSAGETADALRIGHRRSEKRAVKGLHQLIRQLRKEKLLIQEEALSAALETRATAVPLPPDLADGILSAAPDCFGRRPKLALARSTLRAMSWAACKGRLKIAGAILGALIVLVAALALSAGALRTSSGPSGNTVRPPAGWGREVVAESRPGPGGGVASLQVAPDGLSTRRDRR